MGFKFKLTLSVKVSELFAIYGVLRGTCGCFWSLSWRLGFEVPVSGLRVQFKLRVYRACRV